MADRNVFTYNSETGFLNTNTDSTSNFLSDELGGFGGGGGSVVGTSPSITDEPTYSYYVVRVASNEIGASIFVNGVNTQKTTPENINVSKTDLLNGDVEITLVKEGFATLERYVVSMPTQNSVVIKNALFDTPLGLSLRTVSVKYFVGTTEATPTSTVINGNFIFANFQLSRVRVTPIDSKLLNFKVLVAGTTNSVLITKNGQVNLYPNLGNNSYEDIVGTLFSVKSSDAQLYRITQIIVEGEGEAIETLSADEDESLNINLTLNKSYTLKIQTEELSQQLPALDPRISLLNSDPRTYNINSSAGVPLVIRKNLDVKVITVIVGENVYEFDSLDEGDVTGITIPHKAFRGLGQYSIKLYPFSLKTYETQPRPTTPPLTVKQNIKNIKRPIVELTEVMEPVITKPFITPYQLPLLPTIPTTPTISTKPTTISTGPIVRSGGGVIALDRDFGSGFGVERVADRTQFRENIQ